VRAGVQSALYCRCGNEKILRPRPLCHLAAVRLPRTSVNTSIRCKSRLLIVTQPKVCPPSPDLREGMRHFYFAQVSRCTKN
jgi:hypothetical protein